MKGLLVLDAGATAWVPMVRMLTTQGVLQPGWTGMGNGEPALHGPPQAPGAHLAQPSAALQEATCHALMLEVNCLDLGEHLSLLLPWTKAARTRDSSGRVQVWLQGTLGIPATLSEWQGSLLGLKASLRVWSWDIMSFHTGSRWKANDGILGIVRNGEAKCAEGLLGLLPSGRGTLDGNKEVGGVFSVGRGPLEGVPGGMGLCGETTVAAIISHPSHSNGPIPTNPTFLGVIFLISVPCLRPSLAPHFS